MTDTALTNGLRLPTVEVPALGRVEVAAYLAASGDDNPLHSDAALARAAGFDDIVIPGLMVMGQMSEMLASWPPCAHVHELKVWFTDPVVVGTPLTLSGRVVALRPDGHAILRLTARVGRRVSVMGEAVIVPA